MSKNSKITRRDVFKYGAAAGAASVFGKAYGQVCPTDQTPFAISATLPNPPGGKLDFTGCGVGTEPMSLSPFILNPFTDPLPVPQALLPGYRDPAPGAPLSANQTWAVREKNNAQPTGISVPGPGPGEQDSFGERPVPGDGATHTFVDKNGAALPPRTMNFGGAMAGTHQLYPGGLGSSYQYLQDTATLWDGTVTQPKAAFDLLAAQPILYHIRLQVAAHQFTTSDVQPITPILDAAGNIIGANNAGLPQGANATPGAKKGTFKLPPATIYGFNGTFPGPMINFEYGKPAIVRFENDLDQNPACLDRQDFGAPDWAFLTHLHNGHTAPESDGQPHHLQENEGGYQPGQWSDNLYLGYAAGGLENEKQSFLWFHDHRMHHTGPNVYKGMVGLMPHYDTPSANNPIGIDSGDETQGLKLPGVRVPGLNGTFNVNFDIPLALYDVRFEDGITPHQDEHTPLSPGVPGIAGFCGQTHPEWWGKHFLKHYPNHGFVGDVFTVNCVAYPVLTVERRRYRFRFLGASLARQYLLSFRRGSLTPAPGRQGQWTFGKADKTGKMRFDLGQQCMQMMQIASEGGLLGNPVVRDDIEIWPAKRREVVVDFTRYMDGTPTKAGDEIFLTNTAEMTNGRKITSKGVFAVPLLKFVISARAAPVDNSDPLLSVVPGTPNLTVITAKTLRPRRTPKFLAPVSFTQVRDMTFTLQRGGTAGGETEWLINGLQFNPAEPLWAPIHNSFETWGIDNGGGGWTHPMHIHMEEHQVTFRADNTTPHPEDVFGLGKEDVVALEGSEPTNIYRGFRTFLGNYVAHCHNLAHEDHNMMYGWCISRT